MSDTEDEGDMFDPAVQRREEYDNRVQTETNDKALHDMLRRRAEAYRRLFAHGHAEDLEIVMTDLKRFCRAEETTFNDNARVHALLTGRQEVYLRIMDHLRLDHDDLFAKYNPPQRR